MDKALVDSVLELPPNERAKLLDVIVMSLDRPDSQIDNIWLDEAQKRLEAFKAGRTKGIPARDVLGGNL
ncbi:MAG: addiction module protein [Hormoscilla sp. GM102CHS1]|nr:addiction module protein [Hormoscilla sp. GM102CHS1]MBC6479742.1 addiction module protein [Hormoscilla sp. GM7CHS1pb]